MIIKGIGTIKMLSPIKIPDHLHPKRLDQTEIKQNLELVGINILQQDQKIRDQKQTGSRRFASSVSACEKHCRQSSNSGEKQNIDLWISKNFGSRSL